MQSEVDRLNTEVKQKETNIAVTSDEKEKTLVRLKQEESKYTVLPRLCLQTHCQPVVLNRIFEHDSHCITNVSCVASRTCMDVQYLGTTDEL